MQGTRGYFLFIFLYPTFIPFSNDIVITKCFQFKDFLNPLMSGVALGFDRWFTFYCICARKYLHTNAVQIGLLFSFPFYFPLCVELLSMVL